MELVLYLLLYSFVGWAVGVGCIALKDGRFVNRGVLNLPLTISEGITAVILLLVLPTLEQHPVWQFLMTWIIVYITDALTEQFVRNISGRKAMAETKPHSISPAITLVLRTVEALAYLVLYLLLHPFIRTFVAWLPDLLVTVVAMTGILLVLVDYLGVHYALRTGRVHKTAARRLEKTMRLADRLVDRIWDRLEWAYPGVERAEPENKNGYVFARGICFDKLVWVFLISSFLGALVEMVYCRAVGGTWMNRSSVLYGPYSYSFCNLSPPCVAWIEMIVHEVVYCRRIILMRGLKQPTQRICCSCPRAAVWVAQSDHLSTRRRRCFLLLQPLQCSICPWRGTQKTTIYKSKQEGNCWSKVGQTQNGSF